LHIFICAQNIAKKKEKLIFHVKKKSLFSEASSEEKRAGGEKKVHRGIIIRRKKASNVGSASLDFSLHNVMQSAFLIPQRPPGQFSAILALSFQGIAYVNMLDKILSVIKQLMCLKFAVVVYSL